MDEICLLNDSFPPLVDGVANTVVNYASLLNDHGHPAFVVTPNNPDPDVNDAAFPFEVVRYPSIDTRSMVGYPAGNPFHLPTINALTERNPSIIHCHCPFMSMLLARQIRETVDAPLILTYHTKFDVDIARAVKNEVLQAGAIGVVVDNVSAADELWVVSSGAGENIRALGYEGNYVVMQNGVDIPRAKASEAAVAAEVAGLDLPGDVPVFLFVGRMMWYKGVRIILDALRALAGAHLDFRMVFIGDGTDREDMEAYAKDLGIAEKCLFLGAIHERERLTCWYTRADLLLFPSTYDTNGLVVREAAACSCAAVLVRDSCAADGVTDGQNALLIEEDAASMAVCLARIIDHPEAMADLGENAARDLYVSWDEAVGQAYERYQVVLENYRAGRYARKHNFSNAFYTMSGGVQDFFTNLAGLFNNDRRSDRYQ